MVVYKWKRSYTFAKVRKPEGCEVSAPHCSMGWVWIHTILLTMTKNRISPIAKRSCTLWKCGYSLPHDITLRHLPKACMAVEKSEPKASAHFWSKNCPHPTPPQKMKSAAEESTLSLLIRGLQKYLAVVKARRNKFWNYLAFHDYHPSSHPFQKWSCFVLIPYGFGFARRLVC